MLHNEIKELKTRAAALNGKIAELNGGAAFLNLRMIEEKIFGFYPAINPYINYHKQAGDDVCLLAGIKAALNGMELRFGLLAEAEGSGYRSCRIASRLFSYAEANDKMRCLALVREEIDGLEERHLNVLERGLNSAKNYFSER